MPRQPASQRRPRVDQPPDQPPVRAPSRSPARAAPAAPRRGHSFAAPGSPRGRSPLEAWHRERLDPDFEEEAALWSQGYRFVAGLDEVGRGCLAGPVVAGAVILPRGWIPTGLRDSKLLTAEDRARLDIQIRERAVAWAVAFVEPEVIDRINILQATLLATLLAGSRLPIRPDALLLDAVVLPEIQLPQRALPRADRLCASVAAASVVAKVARDSYMEHMAELYPGYDLAHNKGYAAPEHRAGLAAQGPSPIHRRSFAGCDDIQIGLWDGTPEGPTPADEDVIDLDFDPDFPAGDDA